MTVMLMMANIRSFVKISFNATILIWNIVSSWCPKEWLKLYIKMDGCQEKMSWQQWTQREFISGDETKPNQIKHPVSMKPNLVFKHWFHWLSEGIWPRSKPRLGVRPSLIGADVCFWFFSLLSEQSLCSQTSLSGPASLELPEGWSDGLLVESFHDFSDS